jgi:hypothetical protein
MWGNPQARVVNQVVTMNRLSRFGEILVGSNPTLRITVFEILLKSKIQNINFDK